MTKREKAIAPRVAPIIEAVTDKIIDMSGVSVLPDTLKLIYETGTTASHDTFTVTPEVEALAARAYTTIITREDGDWVVRVPELPGLVTGGETLDEMYAMLEDAKRAWIATAIALGRPVPTPRGEDAPQKSGKFMVRVPPAIHTALAAEAARQQVSLNELVSDTLAIVATRGFDRVVREAHD